MTHFPNVIHSHVDEDLGRQSDETQEVRDVRLLSASFYQVCIHLDVFDAREYKHRV
jgi:hypothetical protein